MAKKVQQAKKSFYEIVFQGKPKVVRAYLAGLADGSGHDAEIYFSFEEGIYHEGKVEKFKEMLHVRALDCHVIVDAQISKLLKKLGKGLMDKTGVEIVSHRNIRNASFTYSYHAYAKQYDHEILAAFDARPDNLRLKNKVRELKEDPSAKGVEVYSPTHHYEAEGSGTVVGPVDQVIAFKKTLDAIQLIQAEEIQLNLA
ncbi:hypothetical protein CSA17_04980 [bacterium DOLJORAL78_65_58]|nr:MAG: hypothetical protein CSB20_13405 [bacterium DOLZORAL124_64_63]PIE75913.1 MAG: hypothetical protein CSA17_04980 [bacterium DOLJORAL78_65_58]